MDWSKLYFGKVSRDEIRCAIDNAEWQSLRKQLKGKPLEIKYSMLRSYYNEAVRRYRLHNDKTSERMLEVRLTNYVTALSRGGLIKVGDYRNCD